MAVIVLFVLLAFTLVALPPLIATIFFDHVRAEPETLEMSSATYRSPTRRRRGAHSQETSLLRHRINQFGRRF